MKNLNEVVRRPIITEKSIALAGKNKYTFEVARRASKGEIKKAVEKLFSVKVLDVKTANIRGKEVRTGRRRVASKKSDWKKAVVTVSAGDKIEIFESE